MDASVPIFKQKLGPLGLDVSPAGECTFEEAIYILKRDTRHFAKRQLTWFRREKDVIWVNKNEFKHDEEQILSSMLDTIRERTNIKC